MHGAGSTRRCRHGPPSRCGRSASRPLRMARGRAIIAACGALPAAGAHRNGASSRPRPPQTAHWEPEGLRQTSHRSPAYRSASGEQNDGDEKAEHQAVDAKMRRAGKQARAGIGDPERRCPAAPAQGRLRPAVSGGPREAEIVAPKPYHGLARATAPGERRRPKPPTRQ